MGRGNLELEIPGTICFLKEHFAVKCPGKTAILDADFLWLLKESTEWQQTIKNIATTSTTRVVLTPNAIEFIRLWEAIPELNKTPEVSPPSLQDEFNLFSEMQK